MSTVLLCRQHLLQERRDAARRGQFTVKRRPQASKKGAPYSLDHDASEGRILGFFERKPAVVLDPLGVRPILDVDAYKPRRKPVGVYGRERR